MKATELLYPASCVLCGQPAPAHRLCPDCEKQLRRQSGWRMLAEVETLYAASYAGAVRHLLLDCKFHARTVCFDPFAALLAQRWQETGRRADVVSWVPCSPWRARARGFDQSEELARRTGALLGLPVQETLRRRLFSRRQSNLDAGQRRQNARSGFLQSRNADVVGQCVLLVDDILTTGATLSVCGQLLREAGARQVTGLVVACGNAEKQA